MSEYSAICGSCGLPTLIDVVMVTCGECGAILCSSCRQTKHCQPTGIVIPIPVDNAKALSNEGTVAPLKTMRLGRLQKRRTNETNASR